MVRIILNKPMPEIVEPAVVTDVKYGLLYNWWAYSDSRFCTEGYRVPLETDFQNLAAYLASVSKNGGDLKETGFEYWNTPNTGATNSFNFNGRGGGIREILTGDGFDKNFKVVGHFATKTEVYDTQCVAYSLNYNNSTIQVFSYSFKGDGISVRPIKITPTASDLLKLDGEECDPYEDTDGNMYRTVKIGDQVWVADNIFQTKLNDGTIIPEETSWVNWDNNGWYGFLPLLCAHNNDWSNVLI